MSEGFFSKAQMIFCLGPCCVFISILSGCGVALSAALIESDNTLFLLASSGIVIFWALHVYDRTRRSYVADRLTVYWSVDLSRHERPSKSEQMVSQFNRYVIVVVAIALVMAGYLAHRAEYGLMWFGLSVFWSLPFVFSAYIGLTALEWLLSGFKFRPFVDAPG